MVSSRQSIVLHSVPIAVLFDMLKILHQLPMSQPILRALFRRCTQHELRDWAKILPCDHPIARKVDHEVHRRRMAGESSFFHFCLGVGPFLIPFFPFPRCVSGHGFSTRSPVARPPLHLPSAMSTDIGPRGTGDQPFLVNFFSQIPWTL